MTTATTQGALDFDPAALGSFLTTALGPDNGCFRLERIGGGQSNPTYFLDWNTRQLVLRKKPNGPVLKGAHAIEREHRVIAALQDSAVPVPRPILLHHDPANIGTPFYLMERVEGRVFDDPSLKDVPAPDRRAIWLAAAKTLADLHELDPHAQGLGDFGKAEGYFERQINLWNRQYLASDGDPIPQIEQVHAWLMENMPAEEGPTTICHGDFRLGNLIFHPTKPQVVAVLDWELSTLGHPMADLGFVCMAWHSTPDEYGGLLGLDLAALNLPDEDSFVDHYLAALGGPARLLPFHKVFALFRFAVIFVGIADRARLGTATDPKAAALAPLARRFAIRASEIARNQPHDLTASAR